MFDDIIFEEHEVQVKMLRGMLATDSVPHALLFSGKEGIGKRKIASDAAQALLCEAKTFPACGACLSCKMVLRGVGNVVLTLQPEGEKRKVIKIENIRGLQEKLFVSSNNNLVCIIDKPEFMTHEASNAFLKLLEEPPEGVFFILVTANKDMLLPTILSRMAIIRFNVLSKKAIRDILMSDFVERDMLKLAVNFCNGGVGRAKQFILDCEQGHRLACEKILQLICDKKLSYVCVGECVQEWCEISKKEGLDVIKRRFVYLAYYFRDFMLWKDDKKDLLCNSDITGEMPILTQRWTPTSLLFAWKTCLLTAGEINSSINLFMFLNAFFWKLNNCFNGRIFCKK